MTRGFRQIDNDIFRVLMAAKLTGAGYGVVLTVIDRTIGFKQIEANIPLSYFQRTTGLSRRGIVKAIKQAKGRRIIQVTKNGTRPTSYALNPPDRWLTGEPVLPIKGLRLLMKACEKNEPLACYKLGEIYEEGENALEDEYTARDFFRMSCDLDYQAGCKKYRNINERGLREY